MENSRQSHRTSNYTSPHSGYQNLRYFYLDQDTSLQVREVARHFLERVKPEHELPINADLIAKGCWLSNVLLNES